MNTTDNKNNNELEYALQWLSDGKPIVIATVIETWGSSPRPVGSYMVINSASNFMGSVSGGCVEGAVITEALEVMESGIVKVLEFSVANDDAWEVGLSCGGNIRVLLERHLQPEIIQQSLSQIDKNTAFALVTDLESGEHALLDNNSISGNQFLTCTDEIISATDNAIKSGKSKLITVGERQLFVRCFRPAIKLFIVGAVHIAQVLAPMAKILGYEIIIIEPRELFAQDQRFKEQQVKLCWPDEVLNSNIIDSGSAIVTLTHDPKIDDIALQIALDSKAFYIGSLGSKRTHQQRVKRLKKLGFSIDQINKIHAPIGLNLGGRAPDEIAVAVLAQIVQARYK